MQPQIDYTEFIIDELHRRRNSNNIPSFVITKERKFYIENLSSTSRLIIDYMIYQDYLYFTCSIDGNVIGKLLGRLQLHRFKI